MSTFHAYKIVCFTFFVLDVVILSLTLPEHVVKPKLNAIVICVITGQTNNVMYRYTL